MALDSTTTVAQAYAQLNDNLAWDASPTKAAAFLEAARWLLVNRANSAKAGVSLSWDSLQGQIEEAQTYVRQTTLPADRKQAYFVRGRARRR